MAELSILTEAYETAKVYKSVTTTGGGWSSSTSTTSWEYVQDIQIYIEPTTPDDTTINNQNYQGGVYRGLFPIEDSGVLQEGYGLIGADGTSYIVVGKPQPFNYILPHMACILKSRQFEVS